MYWPALLLINLALAWWVHRVVQTYDRAFRAGAPADWRLLKRAMRGATKPEHVAGSDSCRFSLACLAVIMSGCAAALHQTYPGQLWTALFYYLFAWALALAALMDRRTGLLVDALTVPLMVLALFLSLMGMTVPWLDALLAVVVVGLILLPARMLASRWRRSDALGLGDVKLFVAIALWLGLQGVLIVLLFANVFLLLFVGGKKLIAAAGTPSDASAEYPFGPFVFAAVLVFYMLIALFGE